MRGSKGEGAKVQLAASRRQEAAGRSTSTTNDKGGCGMRNGRPRGQRADARGYWDSIAVAATVSQGPHAEVRAAARPPGGHWREVIHPGTSVIPVEASGNFLYHMAP